MLRIVTLALAAVAFAAAVNDVVQLPQQCPTLSCADPGLPCDLVPTTLSNGCPGCSECANKVGDKCKTKGVQVYNIRQDPRRCAFPHCGGVFVSQVDTTLTCCGDKKLAEECYFAFQKGQWNGDAVIAARISKKKVEGYKGKQPHLLIKQTCGDGKCSYGRTCKAVEGCTRPHMKTDSCGCIKSCGKKVCETTAVPTTAPKNGECTKDKDCDDDSWCRPDDFAPGSTSSCVPFATEGDSCEGFVTPDFRERCAPGLSCLNTDLRLADAPGICTDPVCETSDDCPDFAYCNNEKCQTRIPENFQCKPEAKDECVDGLLCVKGERGNSNVCAKAECSANQEYDLCGSACPKTCANKDDLTRICIDLCVPGCFCKEGFVLNKEQICVKEAECPPVAPTCGIDEDCDDDEWCRTAGRPGPYSCVKFRAEGESCGGFVPAELSTRCGPGFACLNSRPNIPDLPGTCVKEACAVDGDCPEYAYCTGDDKCRVRAAERFSCGGPNDAPCMTDLVCTEGTCQKRPTQKCEGKNEEYNECGSACEQTCAAKQVQNLVCTQQCVSGCFCKDGYLRDSEGVCRKESKCITPVEIPSGCVKWFDGCNTCTAANGKAVKCTELFCASQGEPKCLEYACPAKMEYKQCGTSCPATCETPYPEVCNTACNEGCFCIEGLVLSKTGKCIKKKNCVECLARPCARPDPNACDTYFIPVDSDGCDLCPQCVPDIPKDCAVWYDGCNQCKVENGETTACTKRFCVRLDEPKCIERIPEISCPELLCTAQISQCTTELITPVDENGCKGCPQCRGSGIPFGCTSWFDGCNTCSVRFGKLESCTEKACDTYEYPKCLAKKPCPKFKCAAPVECGPTDWFTPVSEDGCPLCPQCPVVDIPVNCVSWFDGCNTCKVESGKAVACTKEACLQMQKPKCLKKEVICPVFRCFPPGDCEADKVFTPVNDDGCKLCPICPVEIPFNCVSWFDGCNTCQAKFGEIGACTKKACPVKQTPKCLKKEVMCPLPGCILPTECEAEDMFTPVTEDGCELCPICPPKIPANCAKWFDGCNECKVNRKGKLKNCTERKCKQLLTPKCVQEK